jgi:HTH-type transcriptional regulator / antitoxin HipB
MILHIMTYVGQHIVAALKEAREKKGLSQRALSAQAGVPQSHISRIERGAVDLQLSSLIEIARVLDLELVTVPRKLVPAVQAIVRTETSSPWGMSEGTAPPAYMLDEEDGDGYG